MNRNEIYAQNDEAEIDRLTRSQPTALLVTRGEKDQEASFGVFNPVFLGRSAYIHLGARDEQVRQLRETGRATLVFQDILAVIPSYWVDARYGGAATAYYRYAELRCSAVVLDDPAELVRVMQSMMDRFQPEKGYAPLDSSSELYRKSFAAIVGVRLDPVEVRAKWKLGQNRPQSVRLEVARRLRERGTPSDLRAAEEIDRSLAGGPSAR
ncbi:MAG: FMN-binding negative transcriptional regulator [Proteobacteria bacterium]|nr:FMN-binding negative transcriptional regulator [Pseudomonadota bacterium]